jgi:hypothetical protein
MDAQLNHEFMLMQQSRCNQKYQHLINDIQDLPEKLNQSIVNPMNKFSRGISRLVKNRGKMLFLLDKRVSKVFKK